MHVFQKMDKRPLLFNTRFKQQCNSQTELGYISRHLVPLFDFTKSLSTWSTSQTYEFQSPSAQNKKEGQVQQRERKPNWSKDEDEALCNAWWSISEDPATLTDDQLRTKFWDRILAEFSTVLGWETERYSSGLMNRWSIIQSHVNKYSDCVRAIERNRTSRYNVEESVSFLS